MKSSSARGPCVQPADPSVKHAEPAVVLVGTSFRTARIQARERIARRLNRYLGQGSHLGGKTVLESATVETCNRLELYFVCSSPEEVAASAQACMAFGAPDAFYVKTGFDAILHLFRVASGLDSPVLGEEQILEQVRDAGKTARTEGRAKSVLSSLFDAACSSGRRVRESYEAHPAGRSVSALAVRHALKEVGGSPSGVLIIGSGEAARLASLRLRNATVYLLSARRGVGARFPRAVKVTRKSLREVTGKCDMIIAATRHRGYVLTKRDLPKERKMLILDLGFPRNVDPSVGDLQSVKLYDLDSVSDWALPRSPREETRAERMAEDEARRFDAWLTASRLTPTLADMYRWAEGIREQETVAALRRLPDLSAHDREVVEGLSRRLTGKLLSPHAAFAKGVGDKKDQQERLILLGSIFKRGGATDGKIGEGS